MRLQVAQASFISLSCDMATYYIKNLDKATLISTLPF